MRSSVSKDLPENAVIVPIPGHQGYALQTPYLARAISVELDGSIPVANVLKGKSRVSNDQAKMDGYPLSNVELGFRQVGLLPKGKIPYLLDNCVDNGETAKAAFHALGEKGIVFSYAMTDRLLNIQMRHSSLLSK